MTKPVPNDARGNQLNVGDFVCYTTNSRGSGLSFGHIKTIKEKPTYRNVRNNITGGVDKVPGLDFKIVVENTDAFGNPVYDTTWDRTTGKRVTTTKRTRSGQIDHYDSKFLRL